MTLNKHCQVVEIEKYLFFNQCIENGTKCTIPSTVGQEMDAHESKKEISQKN